MPVTRPRHQPVVYLYAVCLLISSVGTIYKGLYERTTSQRIRILLNLFNNKFACCSFPITIRKIERKLLYTLQVNFIVKATIACKGQVH